MLCKTAGTSLYIAIVYFSQKISWISSLTCLPLEFPGGEQRFLLEAYQSRRQLSWIGDAIFGRNYAIVFSRFVLPCFTIKFVLSGLWSHETGIICFFCRQGAPVCIFDDVIWWMTSWMVWNEELLWLKLLMLGCVGKTAISSVARHVFSNSNWPLWYFSRENYDDFVKLIGLNHVPEHLKVRAIGSSKPFGN